MYFKSVIAFVALVTIGVIRVEGAAAQTGTQSTAVLQELQSLVGSGRAQNTASDGESGSTSQSNILPLVGKKRGLGIKPKRGKRAGCSDKCASGCKIHVMSPCSCSGAIVKEDLCSLPKTGSSKSSLNASSSSLMSSQSSKSSVSSMKSLNTANMKSDSRLTDLAGRTWRAASSGAQLALIAPLATTDDGDAPPASDSEYEYYYEYVSQ
jgi:hypothetical protein